jgi:hypothetical protein
MASEPLSDYEQLRARNIERNKQVMLALGIDDTDLVLHAAHNANGGKKKAAPKRKLEDSDAPRPSPTRRSSRTRGEPVRLLELDVSGEAESREECSSRTQAPLRGSEVDHALAEAEHNERWAGRQGKATIVGTASYQHTLMRVMLSFCQLILLFSECFIASILRIPCSVAIIIYVEANLPALT